MALIRRASGTRPMPSTEPSADGRVGSSAVTTRPVYVYVEPGTYRISNPIQLLVSTYLVGDALSIPTLQADANLAHPVIVGYDNGQGDLSATKNFYMGLRNFKINTTAIANATNAVAIDWSVSQGCSLTNVNIVMPEKSNHVGISMSSVGSGTLISDSVSPDLGNEARWSCTPLSPL